MRKVLVEIFIENSAFEDSPALEVSRILNTAARMVEDSDLSFEGYKYNEYFLFDSNGNKTGRLAFVKE